MMDSGNKKNLAFYITHMGLGGAQRVVSILSKELKAYYNIYILIIDSRKKTAPDVDAPIINTGGDTGIYTVRVLKSAMCINQVLDDLKIDYCISFLDHPSIITSAIVRDKNLKEKDTAKRFRFISIRLYRNDAASIKPRGFLKRLTFKKADMTVFASKAMASHMSGMYELSPAQSVIIENPYDLAAIDSLAKGDVRDDIKAFMDTHETSVAVARCVPQKGIKYMLKAFAGVLKERPHAGLVIAGDGKGKERLIAFSKKLGISDNVCFAGYVKNPIPIIKNSLLFINTSLIEGFPNALLEAMSVGKCVLHTDCLTGPGEVLREEYKASTTKEVEYADYGILLPDIGSMPYSGRISCIPQITKAWIKALSDADMRDSYGKKARERAAQYSYERCIGKWLELLKQ